MQRNTTADSTKKSMAFIQNLNIPNYKLTSIIYHKGASTLDGHFFVALWENCNGEEIIRFVDDEREWTVSDADVEVYDRFELYCTPVLLFYSQNKK